jgi:hypothetical protein
LSQTIDPNQKGYDHFTISGLENSIDTPGTYQFDFDLNLVSGCFESSDISLIIEVLDSVEITLNDASQSSQDLCYSESVSNYLRCYWSSAR